LVDTYTLANADKIKQIAVGMFIPDGEQLPMLQDGQPAPNNSVMLSPEAVDCDPH
jgi:hypothetical protein